MGLFEGDDQLPLVPVPADAGHPHPGSQRRGALLTPGDKDRFVVDFRQVSAGVGLRLDAVGDGQPGLIATLTDAAGTVVVEVKPGPTQHAEKLAWLPAGRYVLTVQSATPRTSLQPWTVGLWESPEAAALAPPPTPTVPQ